MSQAGDAPSTLRGVSRAARRDPRARMRTSFSEENRERGSRGLDGADPRLAPHARLAFRRHHQKSRIRGRRRSCPTHAASKFKGLHHRGPTTAHATLRWATKIRCAVNHLAQPVCRAFYLALTKFPPPSPPYHLSRNPKIALRSRLHTALAAHLNDQFRAKIERQNRPPECAHNVDSVRKNARHKHPREGISEPPVHATQVRIQR